MKRLAAVIVLFINLALPITANAQESTLKFTEFELDLEAVIASKGSYKDKLALLDDIKQRHGSLTFSESQYFTYMQCRHGRFPDHILSTNLDLKPADSMAAHYLCTTFQESASGDDIFKATYLAYSIEDSIQSAALRFVVALRYAHQASRRQLFNSGIEATAVALRIAQANNLKDLEAVTLAERALVQVQVGLYDEAIENNQRAIELSSTDAYWSHYMLDRGHILTKARKFKLAKATYAEALAHPYNKGNPKSQFIVNSNLAYIYTVTGEVDKNLEVTAEMQRLANESGNEVDIKWAKASRAFALLADGRYDEAKPLLDESITWFQDNEFDSNLVDIYDGWAKLLMEQGYPTKAYYYLAESVKIRDHIQKNKWKLNRKCSIGFWKPNKVRTS